LAEELIEDQLPDKFVEALPAATCTDTTVRKEVVRRVLVAELANAENVLNEEQRRAGIADAVKPRNFS
jgi:hypothetical protein